MQLSLYRDTYGHPRAAVSKPHQALGWFLEQDVQSNVQWAKELIAIIDAVENGDVSSWEGTGNAHTITINADQVHIENEYIDSGSACQLSLYELKSAIMDWISFVEQNRV